MNIAIEKKSTWEYAYWNWVSIYCIVEKKIKRRGKFYGEQCALSKRISRAKLLMTLLVCVVHFSSSLLRERSKFYVVFSLTLFFFHPTFMNYLRFSHNHLSIFFSVLFLMFLCNLALAYLLFFSANLFVKFFLNLRQLSYLRITKLVLLLSLVKEIKWLKTKII